MRRWKVALDAGMDPEWDVVSLAGQVMRQDALEASSGEGS